MGPSIEGLREPLWAMPPEWVIHQLVRRDSTRCYVRGVGYARHMVPGFTTGQRVYEYDTIRHEHLPVVRLFLQPMQYDTRIGPIRDWGIVILGHGMKRAHQLG